MIIIPNMKKILVVIGLGLLLVLANDLINNFATAQQTPGADKIISLPPQTPTNVLSSSPGSSVRPPAVQNGVRRRPFRQQYYLNRVILQYGE